MGDELIVPVSVISGGSAGMQRYTARRTDTIVSVADRFGITVDQLKSWNHLTSSRITPGKSLYVAEPIHLAPGFSRSSRRTHTSSHPSTTRGGSSHGHASTTHTKATHSASSHTSSASSKTAHSAAAPSSATRHATSSSKAGATKKKTTATR